MKTITKIYSVSILLSLLSFCQAQQVTQSTLPSPTPPSIISRTANSRVWERTEYQQSQKGQIIPITHHYTELGTGLCYRQNGQWLDSQEQINILPDGSAAATNGQYQTYFPADIYSGTITLVTPDGLQLESQPVGLSYDDGTNIVLFAQLTNSIGQLISPNQIIYTNAFEGIDADLLYTYRKGGFEQDVVFREQPPTPGQVGLSPADTRLQMLTEFFDCPTPTETVSAVNPRDGLRDTALSFGAIKMKHGRAFLMGNTTRQSDLKQAPVYKSWVDVNGRTLLVEELPFLRVSTQLSTLPPQSAVTATSTGSALRTVSSVRLLPPVHLAQTKSRITQLVKANSVRTSGVVLDYATINPSDTNFTFQGDTTYYITNQYYLYGKTTFEGGSVIKFNSSGTINIDENGSIACQTAPYRPAIFTSQNDDSVGEPIWFYTTSYPNWQDVNIFLQANLPNISVHDLHFCYAIQALQGNWPSVPDTINVRDCQFYNVAAPIFSSDACLYNVLIGYSPDESPQITNSGDAEIYIEGTNLVAENVTSDSGYAFIEVDNSGEAIDLTNCLITAQPIISPQIYGSVSVFGTNGVVWVPVPSNSVYQVVGSGNYYLTTNSPGRGTGTTNIDSALLSELAQKTTWPPVVYAGTNISSLGTLGQTVTRDTNILSLDIGYHYDPLDYAFGGCDLYSNLTITAGTAVAWYEVNGAVRIPIGALSGQPYGITLNSGANLSFNGNASQPCIVARSGLVQEGGNRYWWNTGWNLGLVFMGLSQEATVSANFTKWMSTGAINILQDRASLGQGFFKNCEFYNNFITSMAVQYLDYTNCLFFRPGIALYYSPNFTLANCTAFNGGITMDRSSAVDWFIEDCSFDGTGFNGSDSYSGIPSFTTINFNAYNTNNFSWQTYILNPSYNGYLEVVGSNDQMVASYNWESIWSGNFYLPPNSPIVQMGSTNASALGLYEFTTQTNQFPNSNNIVDIGYHYVALDQNGNPVDSYLPGIPNYIFDVVGNGMDTNGLPYWYECPYFGQTGVNPNAMDPDGFTTYENYLLDISPIIDQSGQTSSHLNYSYTPADWLNGISGAITGSIGLDNEGNIQTVSQ